MSALPEVDRERVAVMGFCYGGGAALRAAAANGDSVGACIAFYGSPIEGEAVSALADAGTAVFYGVGARLCQWG